MMYTTILNTFLFCLVSYSTLLGQIQAISLQEAIDLALEEDPSILRDRLAFAKYDQLQGAGTSFPLTQVSLSGDEFNFDGISGVQSLNIQQNFKLPGVSKAYNQYYKALSSKTESQLKLTENEVRKSVEQAYFLIIFAKRKLVLVKEAQTIYEDFLMRTQKLMQSGEIGKIPVTSARLLTQKSQMELDHAQHEVEVAKELFNIWLGKDQKYDAIDSINEMEQAENVNLPESSTFLKVLQADKEITAQNINIIKAKLLPQINAGAKLQSVNGGLLFWGYQAGVNIPLFRKYQNKKIEAEEIELEISEASISSHKKEINLKIAKLKNHAEHLKSKIDYLENTLIEAVEEQKNLLLVAYENGEGTYLEYMMALENYTELKLMQVSLREEYYLNFAELRYWSASN